MPAARLELARANPADFESAVSTNSTMPACLGMIAEENIVEIKAPRDYMIDALDLEPCGNCKP